MRTTHQIDISRINPEASGDWHDKPLRWIVIGPAGEVQKFSTKKEAQKYKSLWLSILRSKNCYK